MWFPPCAPRNIRPPASQRLGRHTGTCWRRHAGCRTETPLDSYSEEAGQNEWDTVQQYLQHATVSPKRIQLKVTWSAAAPAPERECWCPACRTPAQSRWRDRRKCSCCCHGTSSSSTQVCPCCRPEPPCSSSGCEENINVTEGSRHATFRG